MAKIRKNVKLNKPFRTPSAKKKFAVYVRDKSNNKITFVMLNNLMTLGEIYTLALDEIDKLVEEEMKK